MNERLSLKDQGCVIIDEHGPQFIRAIFRRGHHFELSLHQGGDIVLAAKERE